MPRLPPELTSAQRRDGETPISRLGQAANLAEIDELGCGEWTTLYESQRGAEGSRYSYSGLMSPAQVAEALEEANWNQFIGQAAPGFSQRYDNGVTVTAYDRFSMSGVEPILYVRDFHGIKSSSLI